MPCKKHWNKNIPIINKFNGFYNDAKNTHASDQSEDQLMELVRAKWKEVMKKKRSFPMEHWWAKVKVQHKWARAYPVHKVQKRIKLNSSGAYTSSTHDTKGADVVESRRPQERHNKIYKEERKAELFGGRYIYKRKYTDV